MATLIELLATIRVRMKASKEAIGSQSGPLPEPTASQVEGDLGIAEDNIDHILDGSRAPSLDPVNAGSAMSASPTSLEDYAVKCFDWADDADREANTSTPNQDYIGSRLKTIKEQLAGYRSEAGIT